MSRGSYDHFKFVQQWPPAFCATNRCKPGAKQMLMFTIHGLWPDNKTYVPCRALLPLFAGRQPNLKGIDRKFWKEEWDKHGRCSSQTYDQRQYFERSHNMWMETDLTNTFGNLIKGNSLQRNVADIENLIQKFIAPLSDIGFCTIVPFFFQ
ncbi:PREDICTED: ribonuclease S-7-like [Fragaria vesca subsp. vesca]